MCSVKNTGIVIFEFSVRIRNTACKRGQLARIRLHQRVRVCAAPSGDRRPRCCGGVCVQSQQSSGQTRSFVPPTLPALGLALDPLVFRELGEAFCYPWRNAFLVHFHAFVRLEERKLSRGTQIESRERSPKSFSRASFCVHLRGAPCVRFRASPATLSASERDLPRVRSLGVGRFSPRGAKPCSSHQTFRTQGLIRDALRQGNFHILHSLRWTS